MVALQNSFCGPSCHRTAAPTPSSRLEARATLNFVSPDESDRCSLYVYASDTINPVSLDDEVARVVGRYREDDRVRLVTPQPLPVALPASEALHMHFVLEGTFHVYLYFVADDEAL